MSAGFKLPLHALPLRCRWRAVLLSQKVNSNKIVVIVVVVLLSQKVNRNNIVVIVVVVLLPQKVKSNNIAVIVVVDLLPQKVNNNYIVVIIFVVLLLQRVNSNNIVVTIIVVFIPHKANIRIAHLMINPKVFTFPRHTLVSSCITMITTTTIMINDHYDYDHYPPRYAHIPP